MESMESCSAIVPPSQILRKYEGNVSKEYSVIDGKLRDAIDGCCELR
jgi:hypothetical protein